MPSASLSSQKDGPATRVVMEHWKHIHSHRDMPPARPLYGLGARIQGFSEYESQFGEWPHMCSVMGSLLGKPTHFCGASLISPGVVLTAAHCVRRYVGSPDRLRIWCGEWDLRQNIEPHPVQGRDIESIVMHPEYNYDLKNISNYKYDIAVLFTTKNFILNRHINTICLPSEDHMFDERKCILDL